MGDTAGTYHNPTSRNPIFGTTIETGPVLLFDAHENYQDHQRDHFDHTAQHVDVLARSRWAMCRGIETAQQQATDAHSNCYCRAGNQIGTVGQYNALPLPGNTHRGQYGTVQPQRQQPYPNILGRHRVTGKIRNRNELRSVHKIKKEHVSTVYIARRVATRRRGCHVMDLPLDGRHVLSTGCMTRHRRGWYSHRKKW